MSRKNDKRNIIIVFLLVIVLVMSVGFALLGSDLNVTATGTISGEWGVRFTNETLQPIIKTDGVTDLTAQVDTTAMKITLNAEFEKPGDKVVYEFKVENTGSINAYLKSINLEGQSTNTEKIKLSYTVKNNDKSTVYAEGSIAGETAINTIVPVEKVALLNKQTIQNESTVTEYNYLTITFEYLDEITEVASNKSATYTLTLYYEQTDAS